jgi:hypothetical protein
MLHLKLLEKQEQANPKSTRREIITRTKINNIHSEKIVQRINKTKTWFFEKINKNDKPPANMTKMRTEMIQINKIRNEKREIIINTNEIWVITGITWKTYIQINWKIQKK